MKFTLSLGLFPHHKAACSVDGDMNRIQIVFTYVDGNKKTCTRKLSNKFTFRFEGNLYRIPTEEGYYKFKDLYIGPA